MHHAVSDGATRKRLTHKCVANKELPDTMKSGRVHLYFNPDFNNFTKHVRIEKTTPSSVGHDILEF
jgi:hypothetical protein